MVIISQTHSGIHKNNNINNFGIRKIFIIYDVYRTQKMMNVNKKKNNNSGKYDQKKENFIKLKESYRRISLKTHKYRKSILWTLRAIIVIDDNFKHQPSAIIVIVIYEMTNRKKRNNKIVIAPPLSNRQQTNKNHYHWPSPHISDIIINCSVNDSNVFFSYILHLLECLKSQHKYHSNHIMMMIMDKHFYFIFFLSHLFVLFVVHLFWCSW
mgnify:CR=1 FL=1